MIHRLTKGFWITITAVTVPITSLLVVSLIFGEYGISWQVTAPFEELAAVITFAFFAFILSVATLAITLVVTITQWKTWRRNNFALGLWTGLIMVATVWLIYCIVFWR